METGFLDRSLTLDDQVHRYQVYVPPSYPGADVWPVILFLHGNGERGRDGLLQTEVGLGSAIRRHVERYPAIVVFPQLPPAPDDAVTTWQGTGGRIALAALEQTQAEFRVDRERVYLTGISVGGQGAWWLAKEQPERFAALVVVCGWVGAHGRWPGVFDAARPAPHGLLAERLRHLPIWIFHGDADPAVPVDESRRMASALEAVGADVRYTELPGTGHNAWDPAYRSEGLPLWLLVQRRAGGR